MNTKKIICYLLFISLLILGNTPTLFSQDTTVKRSYEIKFKDFKREKFFQLSVFAGPVYPVNEFKDKFGTSFATGLDFLYRINEETSVSLKITDFIFTHNTANNPNGNYLEFAVGPKFYFCPRCFRSSFFFEVRVGPVLINETDFTDTLGVYRNSRSLFKFGASTGVGADIVISNSIFFIVKSNIHTIFIADENIIFVSALGGFSFRF